jgi:uncharacterized membrane protein YeaQ/YmgE (transglycosylase-associated protein family)
MLDFILALVMGGIIGWLASIVMKRDASMGIFWNVIVGCVGSVLGRFLYGMLVGGASDRMRDNPFNLETLGVAFAGAVVLLLIMNLIQRGRLR